MLAGMLRSAVICPQVVRDKTEKSWHLGKIEGPFDNASLERKRVSPVGIVPKKAPGKFRLVHYLSYPEGESVNDYTDSLLTSVSRVFNLRTALSSSQIPGTTNRNREGICFSAAQGTSIVILFVRISLAVFKPLGGGVTFLYKSTGQRPGTCFIRISLQRAQYWGLEGFLIKAEYLLPQGLIP